MHWWLLLIAALLLWACWAAPWRRAASGLVFAWLVEEVLWYWTGACPLGLVIAFDCLVAALILSRPLSTLDWMILAIFPAKFWAYGRLGAFEAWWVTYWMKGAQLALAGPWKRTQRSLEAYSHGSLRGQAR